jgi:FkbM family methyltransferase
MNMVVDRIKDHAFIGSLMTPGGCVVDLGMNLGQFSREIQTKYRSKILGVEPNPALFAKIETSDSLRPLHFAIGVSGAEAKLHVDLEHCEASSLTRRGQSGPVVSVPCISLVELLSAGNVGAIDLLKIDIEGAELDLLRSTPPEYLLQARQMTVEFHACVGIGTVAEIERIIRRLDGIGFTAIDFSTNYSDVLFVNRHAVRLGPMEMASLQCQKYVLGAVRVARRRLRDMGRAGRGLGRSPARVP